MIRETVYSEDEGGYFFVVRVRESVCSYDKGGCQFVVRKRVSGSL